MNLYAVRNAHKRAIEKQARQQEALDATIAEVALWDEKLSELNKQTSSGTGAAQRRSGAGVP